MNSGEPNHVTTMVPNTLLYSYASMKCLISMVTDDYDVLLNDENDKSQFTSCRPYHPYLPCRPYLPYRRRAWVGLP